MDGVWSMVVRISGKGMFWVLSGKKYEWWTLRVVMMGEMGLDDLDKKSEKKND